MADAPQDRDRAKAVAGTSIVESLAGQLGARIDVADNDPGTTVRIGRSADGGVAQDVHHAI